MRQEIFLETQKKITRKESNEKKIEKKSKRKRVSSSIIYIVVFAFLFWHQNLLVQIKWNFFIFLSSFKRFSSFLCSTLSSTSLSNRRHKSSHRRCSIEKTFHKKFATFTGKHLCWSHFLIICRSEDLQLY